MSDENVPMSNGSSNVGRVVREWEINSHLGLMLTIIESLGLQEKQEKAVKDLVKQHTWRGLWNGGTPLIYSREADKLLCDAIEKKYELQNKSTNKESK